MLTFLALLSDKAYEEKKNSFHKQKKGARPEYAIFFSCPKFHDGD